MMKTQIIHVVSDLGPENTNMSRIQFHLFRKMKIISKLGS